MLYYLKYTIKQTVIFYSLLCFQQNKLLKQTKNTLIKFIFDLTKINYAVNSLISVGNLSEKGKKLIIVLYLTNS